MFLVFLSVLFCVLSCMCSLHMNTCKHYMILTAKMSAVMFVSCCKSRQSSVTVYTPAVCHSWHEVMTNVCVTVQNVKAYWTDSMIWWFLILAFCMLKTEYRADVDVLILESQLGECTDRGDVLQCIEQWVLDITVLMMTDSWQTQQPADSLTTTDFLYLARYQHAGTEPTHSMRFVTVFRFILID